MDISIDPMSSVAIYQQIRDRIVEAIARGELRRGDQLLSVRQLASSFAINPTTASKAYDLLRQESLVATNAKQGTFVAADPRTSDASESFVREYTDRVRTVLAEGRARGISDADLRRLCLDVADEFLDEEES
ncbi:GntR family transcriptional regulator [Austwickia chelonae]|uniref:GntR family transcriptional regulator n=1 Tax=Austwickia chelonae TaxID=100225 RepID=UPI0013C36D02|nr:GntR family transcriptional regulator [Austwickia chelonae]